MTRKLYDPQIPPEREVRQRLLGQLAEQRGRSEMAISRGPGEQFICTCVCGAVDVTSDTGLPGRFADQHRGCRAA